MSKIKNLTLILIILFVANLISSFFLGMLLTIGGNVKVIGFNKLAFDPMITIAYMILYYFITLFYQPASRAQFYLFLFVLFLSFTVSFMQGALYLVVLYFLLRKFNLI